MPRLALLLTLAAHAGAIAFVTKPVGGFLSRTKALVNEQKAANKIRKRRKDGVNLLYPEWDRLENANNDIGKCFSVLWLALYAKLYTPLALYFYPGMLPSTYETPVTRARRFADGEKRRKQALEKMLAKAEVRVRAPTKDGRVYSRSMALAESPFINNACAISRYASWFSGSSAVIN